jgi:hypothetical protein
MGNSNDPLQKKGNDKTLIKTKVNSKEKSWMIQI